MTSSEFKDYIFTLHNADSYEQRKKNAQSIQSFVNANSSTFAAFVIRVSRCHSYLSIRCTENALQKISEQPEVKSVQEDAVYPKPLIRNPQP